MIAPPEGGGPLKVRPFVLLALLMAGVSTVLAQPAAMKFTGPFLVSGIIVDGNTQTKEKIILREFTFREGDTLGVEELYQELGRSRENLLNLGLFNTVSLLPTYLGPHEVFITVTVNERWFWWPQPIIHFADPNFNT